MALATRAAARAVGDIAAHRSVGIGGGRFRDRGVYLDPHLVAVAHGRYSPGGLLVQVVRLALHLAQHHATLPLVAVAHVNPCRVLLRAVLPDELVEW